MVLGLIPALLWNKLLRGRYLDIFVTHSAPEKIQDDTDLPHRGIRAFRWLIKVFKPRLHLHGHVHLYTLSNLENPLRANPGCERLWVSRNKLALISGLITPAQPSGSA
jgi:Icc-related predicted phosphoesterase